VKQIEPKTWMIAICAYFQKFLSLVPEKQHSSGVQIQNHSISLIPPGQNTTLCTPFSSKSQYFA